MVFYSTVILFQARLTKAQVDEFVEILLPMCLEVNIYSQSDVITAFNAVNRLATLRPRLVISHLLEAIETGFSTPEIPLRITRPLGALSECVLNLFSPCIVPFSFYRIGAQPCDQLHNSPPVSA